MHAAHHCPVVHRQLRDLTPEFKRDRARVRAAELGKKGPGVKEAAASESAGATDGKDEDPAEESPEPATPVLESPLARSLDLWTDAADDLTVHLALKEVAHAASALGGVGDALDVAAAHAYAARAQLLETGAAKRELLGDRWAVTVARAYGAALRALVVVIEAGDEAAGAATIDAAAQALASGAGASGSGAGSGAGGGSTSAGASVASVSSSGAAAGKTWASQLGGSGTSAAPDVAVEGTELDVLATLCSFVSGTATEHSVSPSVYVNGEQYMVLQCLQAFEGNPIAENGETVPILLAVNPRARSEGLLIVGTRRVLLICHLAYSDGSVSRHTAGPVLEHVLTVARYLLNVGF